MNRLDRARAIDATLAKAAAGQVVRAGRLTDRMIQRVYVLSVQGEPVGPAVEAWNLAQVALLDDSLLVAHLGAFVDGVREIEDRRPVRAFATRQDQAIGAARRFLDLDEATIAAIRERYGDWAALTWSREITDSTVAIEATIRQTIVESIAEGDHVQRGMERLNDALGRAGLTGAKPSRLEQIYRTQTQLAYSAGSAQFDRMPAVDEILWGYEYVDVGDDRTRESHAALSGTRLPKGDPAWDSIRPPNGFNCRCQLIRIYYDEPELAIPHRPPEFDTLGKPDEGWSFNPLSLVQDLPEAA